MIFFIVVTPCFADFRFAVLGDTRDYNRDGINVETMKAILNYLRYTVNSLVRIAIGPVTLSGVMPGQFRDLTKEEVDKILNVY